MNLSEFANDALIQVLVLEHIQKSIPINESFLRIDSISYPLVVSKMRELYESGEYSPITVNEQYLFEKLVTGDKGIWLDAAKRRREVKLDLPEPNPDRTEDGKRFIVYIATDDVDDNSGVPIAKKLKFSSWADGLDINNDDEDASASFWARQQCDKKKDKTTAGFWACYTPELFGDMLKLRGGKNRW